MNRVFKNTKFLSLVLLTLVFLLVMTGCKSPTGVVSSNVSSALPTPTPTDAPTLGDNLRAITLDGFGEPTNIDGGGRFIDIGPYMFTGADNLTKGTVAYRSSDKGETWEKISDYGIDGNKLNQWSSTVVWFNDMLYIGTWQATTGAMLYRANADAENVEDIVWKTIEPNGFDNINNNGFTNGIVFDGYLYIGCFNLTEGSEVWRSKTGDVGSWEMCNEKSWGRADNSDTTNLFVYDGYLYAGTEMVRGSASGFKGTALFRTAGGEGDIVWEQVNENGFGDNGNNNLCGMAVFKDYFYATTWNNYGAEIWRSDMQGEAPWTWEKVEGGGFGVPGSNFGQGLAVLNDELYYANAGSYSFMDGTGAFFVTSDGENWEQIKKGNFLVDSSGIMWMVAVNNKIYLSLVSVEGNGQFWVYEK